LDPVSPIISTAVGRILHFSHRYDEAIDQCLRTLELNPQFPGAYFDVGISYTAKGMYPEAIAAAKKLGKLSRDPKRGLIELAWVYGRMGKRDKAMKCLEKLKELSRTEDLPRLPLAVVYIGLGDFEKAFDLIEEGYTARDTNLLYIRCEPAFDPLREDPRFQNLLGRMDLSEEVVVEQAMAANQKSGSGDFLSSER
jgi:serine/threonine-protein kinase